MDPELKAYLDAWQARQQHIFDDHMARMDALLRSSTRLGPAEPGSITGPVTASSDTAELVSVSARAAARPALGPSIVASPVAAPAAPMDTIAVVPASCSTECATQAVNASTTTTLLPWVSGSSSSPATSMTNDVVSTELAPDNDDGEYGDLLDDNSVNTMPFSLAVAISFTANACDDSTPSTMTSSQPIQHDKVQRQPWPPPLPMYLHCEHQLPCPWSIPQQPMAAPVIVVSSSSTPTEYGLNTPPATWATATSVASESRDAVASRPLRRPLELETARDQSRVREPLPRSWPSLACGIGLGQRESYSPSEHKAPLSIWSMINDRYFVTGSQMQVTACSTRHLSPSISPSNFRPVVMLELQLTRSGSHFVYLQELQMDRSGIAGAALNRVIINVNPCELKWSESILAYPAGLAPHCSISSCASVGILCERKLELNNWVSCMAEQNTNMSSYGIKIGLHFSCISISIVWKRNRSVVYTLLILFQSPGLKYMDLWSLTTTTLTEIMSIFSIGFPVQMEAASSIQPKLMLTHAYQHSHFGWEQLVWVAPKYRITACATSDIRSSVKHHLDVTTRGYRSLIYSGDHDMIIPFIGTQAWIRSLNFSVVNEWRPWYVEVDESNCVRLFYYFIPSERNPAEDPIMLWLTGGPGCSAFSGLVYEIGPLSFDRHAYVDGSPKLLYKPDSWTKVSNVIFLDSPVGTGFSYSVTQQGYESSDTKAVTQIVIFLAKWFDEHPEFLSNPLYIAGDSYSGIIVPVITLEIAKGKENGHGSALNLKGYLVGNPVTDGNYDNPPKVPFAHGMGLVSDEMYQAYKESCSAEQNRQQSVQCTSSYDAIDECVKDIYRNHILEPQCTFTSPHGYNLKLSSGAREMLRLQDYTARAGLQLSEISTVCRTAEYLISRIWVNSDTVREALGGRQGTFQGGRHVPVLGRHKEFQLPWDPGGLAATCGQGAFAVIDATALDQGFLGRRLSDHRLLGTRMGYYRDPDHLNGRLQWDPGGFSVASAWGQAEFQGGRDVRNLSYR